MAFVSFQYLRFSKQMKMFFVCFFVLLFVELDAKNLPPDIRRCSRNDVDFDRCLAESALYSVKKFGGGNKQLGIVPLEPFLIEKLDLGNATAEGIWLHQVYYKLYLHGLSNATIMSSEANFTGDNCYWNFTTQTPMIVMISDYTMKGQILMFPINGNGTCRNVLYDVFGEFGTRCERYMKKGRTHLRVTDFSFNSRPKRATFDFTNLIDGNPDLTREINRILNDNSESVYADIAPAINQVMSLVWQKTTNQVFARVSEEELFLD